MPKPETKVTIVYRVTEEDFLGAHRLSEKPVYQSLLLVAKPVYD
jgi:hypothetical protein